MSEILKRSELDDLLDHIINSADDWKDDVDRLLAHDAALRSEFARLARERDEARERAPSLSRELLAVMQARDSYRASVGLRVGMRREVEEILGCGDTMGDNAFGRGLARLRGLLAAESRAARLEEKVKETDLLLRFAWGFIGSIVECKDAGFEKSLPELATWAEEARAVLGEEGK